MIWFLTSFTSFYFQKFVNVIRVLNEVYTKGYTPVSDTDRSIKQPVSLSDNEDTDSKVTFEDEVWTDTIDGKRRREKIPLSRKMSFAGGVDGTGQSIAILTSGGDSQGN